MAGTVAGLRRQHAVASLLALVRRGPLTRKALAVQVGVSRPALSRILNDLIETGHLDDRPVMSRLPRGRGRPETRVELAAGRHLCIAVDLRPDGGRVRGVDLAGNELFQYGCPGVPYGEAAIVAAVSRIVVEARERSPLPLRSVAFSLPAGTDAAGTLASEIILGLDRAPVRQAVADELDLDIERVRMISVAAGAVLANWNLMADRTRGRLLHLQIGPGVGLGLVEHGHLALGRSAVPVAHLPLVADGPGCSCGRNGCAVAVLGFPGFAERSLGLDRDAARQQGMMEVAAETRRRWHAGEERATQAVLDSARWIADLMVAAACFLDDIDVTLGGYPLHLGAEFHSRVTERIDALGYAGEVQLLETDWHDDASAMGVALLARIAAIEALDLGNRAGAQEPGLV